MGVTMVSIEACVKGYVWLGWVCLGFDRLSEIKHVRDAYFIIIEGLANVGAIFIYQS